MPQIKVTITEEEYKLLEKRTESSLNSISKEARVILHQVLYNKLTPTTTTTLSYPPGVRGIPEKPYTVTAEATAGYAKPIEPQQQTTTTSTEQVRKVPASYSSRRPHPLTWLDENEIDPFDTSTVHWKRFQEVYPEITLVEYDGYQQQRRERRNPDPTDPYDPMTNNPYNRRKSVIG